MKAKNKKKFKSVEDTILRTEENIEKWGNDITELKRKISEGKKSLKTLNKELVDLKYSEVIELIKSSEIEPSVALSLIQNNLSENKNENEFELSSSNHKEQTNRESVNREGFSHD